MNRSRLFGSGIALAVVCMLTTGTAATGSGREECRPRAHEHVLRRHEQVIIYRGRHSRAVACLVATGRRRVLAQGRLPGGGYELFEHLYRLSSRFAAFGVDREDAFKTKESYAVDIARGTRTMLTSFNLGGTVLSRADFKRHRGVLVAGIRYYRQATAARPDSVRVLLCRVGDCGPAQDHVVADDPAIHARSARFEDDEACWDRTDNGVRSTECVALPSGRRGAGRRGAWRG